MAKTPGQSTSDAKKARLAEALRVNLKRRKAQSRARSAADESSESSEKVPPKASNSDSRRD